MKRKLIEVQQRGPVGSQADRILRGVIFHYGLADAWKAKTFQTTVILPKEGNRI